MSNRERTYGFSRQDAAELLQKIGSGDQEFPEVKPRGASGFVRDIRLRVDGDNRVLEYTFDLVTWHPLLTIYECNN